MAKNERLDCVLGLVSHGADINAKDNQANTALHIAVELANVAVTKALLVFDADLSLVNNEGSTAWDLAMKKVEESGIMDFKDREGILYALYAIGAGGCSTPVGKNGQEIDFKKIRQSLAPQQKRLRSVFDEMLANKAQKMRSKKVEAGRNRGRLLSLDGGGMKGLVLTRMLLSMEKALEAPIPHCFDWVAGTSTGGILALALVTGKSVLECQCLYMKLKDKVFVGNKPYDSKPLENLLQEYFGSHTKMSEIQHPK